MDHGFRGVIRLTIATIGAALLASCATVEPGHAAVLMDSYGRTRALGEGTTPIPPYSQVDDFDLRQQARSENFLALTADGVPVRAGDSVVTYELRPSDLVAADREIGADYARTLVFPVVQSVVRRVLARYRWFDLDTPHIREANAEITALAAERLAPHHVKIESVELRGLFPELPQLNSSIEETSVWAQRVEQARIELDVARQKAEERRQEAAGIAAQNRLVAPTLWPAPLRENSLRAWEALIASPHTTVQVVPDTRPYTLEVSP